MPAESDQRENVIDVLRERDLINLMTESELPEAAATQRLTVYCGFDASAPSLQIGNLVPVMMLAHFQRHGHRPIIVVGGGTGMIGDPSGKSAERTLLDEERVRSYAELIRQQLQGYLSFEGESGAILVNNADWLGKMDVLEFLRDIGKHFTVNSMLAKESVKARLENREQGISYTEFSYMVLQSTDYLHLFDTYGCTVQIGGTDQWGNLTAGVDLIRKVRQATVHAMAAPLILSSTGAKFGKSEGNALYLDPEMTTPYALYQYWINVDDRDVEHYLKVFTFLPLEEIADIMAEQRLDPGKRLGQKRLAFEVTKLIHGEEIARAVMAASEVLFGEGIGHLTPEVIPHLRSAVPAAMIPRLGLEEGLPIVEALVAVGAQPSKGAARRVIQQGGLYVNDERWKDPEARLTMDMALFGRAVLLRTGKNRYHLLLVED